MRRVFFGECFVGGRFLLFFFYREVFLGVCFLGFWRGW